jgi:vacuolar-type H+-ATPase subunit H
MWNLRSLKMSVMLVTSGVALVAALPVKAQQVILTPGGTMFQPMVIPGTEIGSGQPAPAPIVALDPSLPSYDILPPEQLKPGKIIFRGRSIEILAPDDPRISDEARGYIAPPDGVWVIQETMPGATSSPSKISAVFFLAPPSTISPILWNGVIKVGERVPSEYGAILQGEVVILANDDPRIPAEFKGVDLGESRFWALDSRALDPTIPITLFKPFLARVGYMGATNTFITTNITTKEGLVSAIQKEDADRVARDAKENADRVVRDAKENADRADRDTKEKADRAAQDFLASPIVAEARREQLRIILSNPEIYSVNLNTWGKPVKDVVDAQGNVVLSKQQIIDTRIYGAKYQLAGGDDGSFARNAEWTMGNQYNVLIDIPETVDQIWTGKIQFPGLQESAKFYQQIITDRGIVADQLGSPLSGGTGNVTTQGVFESLSLLGASVPLAGTGATSFSAATASGSGEIQVSAISSPLTVVPTVSQPVIANQVASPVTSVTVQASQNPTADFATTRSAPRNPVPEQLNQGIIDSPLSNSRIFPGMR